MQVVLSGLKLIHLRYLREICPVSFGTRNDSANLTEADLVIPALHIIEQHPQITTAELIDKLLALLDLPDYELEKLPSRSDSRFEQKVRNLKSHNTLQKLGWAIYKKGCWRITSRGAKIIQQIREKASYLLSA